MNEHDLIDRYIYAVTKKLPRRMREEVSKELSSLISDMLESRCGDIKPTEKDIRVVLTELGNPSDMARGYQPDQINHLIGPDYFYAYKTILLIVIAATSFGMVLSGFILLLIGDSKIPNPFHFFEWIGNAFISIIMIFGFITAFFAIFERKGIKIDMNDNDLSNLPSVPLKEETIPKSSTIFGIAFSIVFCILFLIIPEVFVVISGDTFIPVFNKVSIRNMWYLFVLFTLLSLTRDLYKLHLGRYSKKLLVLSLITNSLSIIPAYLFTHTDKLINQELLDFMSSAIFSKEDASIVMLLFNNIPHIFFIIVLFALFLDVLTTGIKAFQFDKA